MNNNDALSVYEQYKRAKENLEKFSYFDKCEQCWKFYSGDQWDGLKVSGEKPPALNIIAPIVDHKVATVAQNGMCQNFSSMNYTQDREIYSQVCEKLNMHASRTWEQLKMNKRIWDIATEAAVTGDAFVYFSYDGEKTEYEPIDAVNVFLADEQLRDLQKQKYIIFAQRAYVSDVIAQARENGVAEEDIALILPDKEVSEQLGDKAKAEADSAGEAAKCLCLIKLWKEDGCVHFMKCTKDVVFCPPEKIEGMRLYPVAQYTWIPEKGCARGVGEIINKIPNQIEINKALARYLAVIRHCAYPHVVYNKDVVRGQEDITKLMNTVGSVIGLDSPKMQRISDVIAYMEPAQINPQALSIVYELETKTRELAGAGEAATGNIDPEQASGAAIIAVKDAAALPLNNQAAALKEFAEDIARIWFDLWRCYSPNGLMAQVYTPAGDVMQEMIASELLEKLKPDIRVDVSPMNSYSRYASEQALSNLLANGFISFEEYVEALEDDSSAPKGKLTAIITAREAFELNDLTRGQEETAFGDSE